MGNDPARPKVDSPPIVRLGSVADCMVPFAASDARDCHLLGSRVTPRPARCVRAIAHIHNLARAKVSHLREDPKGAERTNESRELAAATGKVPTRSRPHSPMSHSESLASEALSGAASYLER